MSRTVYLCHNILGIVLNARTCVPWFPLPSLKIVKCFPESISTVSSFTSHILYFEKPHLAAMDAQRFHPRIRWVSGTWQCGLPILISLDVQRSLVNKNSRNLTWHDRMWTLLSASNPENRSVLGEQVVATLTSIPRYPKSRSDTNYSSNFHTSSTDLYVAKTTFPAQHTTHFTDVFEHVDDTTITRTVIWLMSPQPGVTCFSKSKPGHVGRRRRTLV